MQQIVDANAANETGGQRARFDVGEDDAWSTLLQWLYTRQVD